MRALAAATVAEAMLRASSAGSRVTPASSIPIPASLKSAASASYLSAVSGRPPNSPPCDPVTTIMPTCSGPTAAAEFSAHTAGGSAISRVSDFAQRRRRRFTHGCLRQSAGGGAARAAFLAAKCGGQRVCVRNDASRHHVGAVADARGHIANRGRRYAEFGKVVDPGNAGAVAPDPGVIENRRSNAELGREVSSIEDHASH